MSENEQLAIWLGFIKRSDYWDYPNNTSLYQPPDFRDSNEWAGALLEKLASECDEVMRLHTHMNSVRELTWLCDAVSDRYGLGVKTWRDAVVNAALEVIKREAA